MYEALGSELIQVPCSNCRQVSSLSLASLERDRHPVCPFCGAALNVDLEAASQDALRKAEELDESVDFLGSID